MRIERGAYSSAASSMAGRTGAREKSSPSFSQKCVLNRSNYVCQIRVCKINSLGMLPVRQCLSNLALR
jgi:hypothetical protein